MSLTSYRAAPPRVKLCAPSNEAETRGATPEGADRSGGFLRRQPGANAPTGARGMYQRLAALERAADHLFGILSGTMCNIRRNAAGRRSRTGGSRDRFVR